MGRYDQEAMDLANRLDAASVFLLVQREGGGFGISVAGTDDAQWKLPSLLRSVADGMEKRDLVRQALVQKGVRR